MYANLGKSEYLAKMVSLFDKQKKMDESRWKACTHQDYELEASFDIELPAKDHKTEMS